MQDLRENIASGERSEAWEGRSLLAFVNSSDLFPVPSEEPWVLCWDVILNLI